MSTRTLLTEADFDALPREEGTAYELSEGELVVTASPRLLHNLVRERLHLSLGAFCQEHKLGVLLTEMDCRLATATIRKPDLAFMTAGRLRDMDLNDRIEGAPDLAVEIVSPSNSPADLALKVRQYLQAGARLVWVIYPETRLVYVYSTDGSFAYREGGHVLDAPTLFPGWSLPLPDLFNVGQP